MKHIIKPDQMTPRERMEAFSLGKEIDRIPCSPFLGEACAPIFGYTIREHNYLTKVIIDVAVGSFEKFRPDSISIGPGLQGIPEAMGSGFKFPRNSNPLFSDPILKDFKDIGKLSPIDPYKDGRIGYFLEGLKVTNDKIGKEVFVESPIGGPFTTAAFLRGIDNFLEDLTRNPEMIHKLLEISTQSVIRYIDAVCDLGLSPYIAEPMASCNIISAKTFREFAKPYLKRCIDKIIERRGNGSTLHICGKTKDIWADMVDIGIASLSLDSIEDIGELKEQFGDKICLIGNLDPVETVMKGTIEEIYEAGKTCILKAYDSPKGFILGSGCDIPIGTHPDKIKAMMDCVRIYSATHMASGKFLR
ncbi:uroporphyrinogen decarboxylase family protein [Clostridium sp. CS001]|uniref:uroporphyrinogen decarboxylase family protein n=1 Tax=Clostridium sp. CS001 TaxID=2880648 RepID=UPI001CF130F9|nr:uroporphyrinogen decarboxylase family protein [Clostridium sp. CS001]MCB2290020.1 uroporphyrinogen decarboxylase family protein [Clostridium sp. CS001]